MKKDGRAGLDLPGGRLPRGQEPPHYFGQTAPAQAAAADVHSIRRAAAGVARACLFSLPTRRPPRPYQGVSQDLGTHLDRHCAERVVEGCADVSLVSPTAGRSLSSEAEGA